MRRLLILTTMVTMSGCATIAQESVTTTAPVEDEIVLSTKELAPRYHEYGDFKIVHANGAIIELKDVYFYISSFQHSKTKKYVFYKGPRGASDKSSVAFSAKSGYKNINSEAIIAVYKIK